ncbi:MAG: RluA family pseudouridine synthase, partial [Clostridia bacterium]
MTRTIEYLVPAARDGVALRDILRRELHISAALLSDMKRREGAILLGGVASFVNVSVHTGDVLTLSLEDEAACSEGVKPTAGVLDIAFENEDVLIVSKPTGMPVHPGQGNYFNSLGNIVVWYFLQKGVRVTYRPVNRLDAGTSGLMAIAKNAYTHAFLGEQISSGALCREYLAVVYGEVLSDEAVIDLPISRCDGSTIKREVSCLGKRAVTHYRTLARANGFSLVKLRLETGRTHQIR